MRLSLGGRLQVVPALHQPMAAPRQLHAAEQVSGLAGRCRASGTGRAKDAPQRGILSQPPFTAHLKAVL